MTTTNPTHWVHDYETLKNCFIGVFEHYKEDKQRVFVIYDKRNDFKDFIAFLKDNIKYNQWHISYNGLSFDGQITQYLLDNERRLQNKTADEITDFIYKFVQQVITRANRKEFQEYPEWKMKIKQIDLFKLNHWDNPAKSSSLKWIQYSMDWFNVEEMPIHHSQGIHTDEELELVLSYCINDVKSTKQIFSLSKEQIALRKALTQEYGINLYSASEPRISKELFAYFLAPAMGIDVKTLKTMRTPRYNVLGKDIMLPYIHFKTHEFRSLQEWVNKLDIDFHTPLSKEEREERYKFSLNYKGVQTDYGLGGLHGACEPGVYEADVGFTIMTSDVN